MHLICTSKIYEKNNKKEEKIECDCCRILIFISEELNYCLEVDNNKLKTQHANSKETS